MKVSNFFITLVAIVSLQYSCSKETPGIKSENIIITMEAEGGEKSISLDNDSWKVAEVINKNGETRMWGNIYNANGEVIAKNSVLQLESSGSLVMQGVGIAFKIIRPDACSLKVVLLENSSGEDFGFRVVLQSTGRIKEIEISQKKSQGYQFGKIAYTKEADDRDSLYTKIAHRITMISNSGKPTGSSISFDPLGGSSEITNLSYFESDMPDAFVWLQKDSVKVDVPLITDNGMVWSDGDKRIYGIVTELMGKSNKTETVYSTDGESRYHTEVEYRKAQFTYTLTLINNRKGQEKMITGKWIEHAPTGRYNVVKL